MDNERLEAMGPEALTEALSDWLDQADEADFDLAQVDAYLKILARKDPVAFSFDPAAAEEAFRQTHRDLFPSGGFRVLEGGASPRSRAKGLAGRISALAAVAALSTVLVVQAMGLDLFGAVARWSKEQFTFHTAGEEAQEGYTPNIYEDSYSHGQAALDAFGVEEKMMPTWKPPMDEGERLGFHVSVVKEEGATLFTEAYRAEDGRGFTFEVRARDSAAGTRADLIGVGGADTEVYEFDGRTYYIAPLSEEEYAVTWAVGRYSGKVYGTMDLEMARHFARSVTQWDEHPYEPPDMSEPPEHATIQAAMAAVGIDEGYAPAWIPEGFVAVQSHTYQREGFSDSANLFLTDVEGERDMSIGVDWYQDPAMAGGMVYEKDDTPVIAYERGGVTFYIMNNLSRKTVAWLDGNISGSFSGELTVEECEQIIDSIPKYAEDQ